ncbi:MAG: hypothetical protein SNJ60_08810 [Pseudanabaenaceae cyanobacterium]
MAHNELGTEPYPQAVETMEVETLRQGDRGSLYGLRDRWWG